MKGRSSFVGALAVFSALCASSTMAQELVYQDPPEEARPEPPRSPRACALPRQSLGSLLGIGIAYGAFVIKIEPGSPAAEAPLGLGDLVVSSTEGDLESDRDHATFRKRIREAAMLSGTTLNVWKREASVETYRSETVGFRLPPRFGAREGLATTFQAMVVSVPGGSIASAAGIRTWDFIDEVDGISVAQMRNVLELERRISDSLARDGRVVFTLARWSLRPDFPGQKMLKTTREVAFTRGSRLTH